jgi:hypothetical protein
MKKVLGISLALVVALTAAASGKPANRSSTPNFELWNDAPVAASSNGALGGLSGAIFVDTVQYGGTIWAADSNRWEALKDSCWTFDTGYASSVTGSGKPAGYHYLMEGWHGFDNTNSTLNFFRRANNNGAGGGINEPCAVVAGTGSMWGGVTLAESQALCFAGGRGYGNGWTITLAKTFSYNGSGSVTLSFLHKTEAEDNFDFFDVLVDTSGDKSASDILLSSFTGATVGAETQTINLTEGDGTLPTRSIPANLTIKFNINSDGSYSDADGLFPTVCGHTSVDNVSLSGGIVDFSNFEAGTNGWAIQSPSPAGDFSDIAHKDSDLGGTYGTQCPCDMADTVLVFQNPFGQHPTQALGDNADQDNEVISPWIDLLAGGDAGRPTKLVIYSGFFDMPLGNYVFLQFQVRWYPSLCNATGLIYTTDFRDTNTVFYFGEFPICNAQGSRFLRNYTSVVENSAEQAQLKFGMVNLCSTEPFGFPCIGPGGNSTPWVDNISLGVAGSATAPAVNIQSFDFLQDNFAADGSLNPASTGRIDQNRIKDDSAPDPGTHLGDTLVVGGDGGNQQTYLVFHVRRGPFINNANLNAWAAARWNSEGALGVDWYSARMDTAEQGGIQGAQRSWMSTLIEEDPKFVALNGSRNDRVPDPMDPSQLNAEIIPDHILTPGSRVDYFLKARYAPGDPRNPGGPAQWFILPDTTGGNYLEVEILPSSTTIDTTWNCTLYVDGHDDRNAAEQRFLEDALDLSLGLGGTNEENRKYDRWDVETPSSGQLHFGKPLNTEYGCSAIQVFAYKQIVWSCAALGAFQLSDENANVLGPWLTLAEVGGNRFWITGDNWAHATTTSSEFSGINLMQNTMAIFRTCNTVKDAGCPTGSALDTTYCLPLSPVGGAHFATAGPINARGNGCPDLRSFDLLARNTAIASSRGQVTYVKTGITATDYASVTNVGTAGAFDYKTIGDGWSIGLTRSETVDTHNPSLCSDLTALNDRVDDVLDWFQLPTSFSVCDIPNGISDVPGGDIKPGPVAFRHSLGNAYPNPMNPTTVIKFTNGIDKGRVTLQIFDVTGRLVKSLLDENMAEGLHEVLWDGTANDGSSAPSGLYFYNMSTADGYKSSKKLVVMK